MSRMKKIGSSRVRSAGFGLLIILPWLMSSPAFSYEGSVDFFKRNGGGRKVDPWASCRLPIKTHTYKLKEHRVQNCGNDDVKSMQLIGSFPRGFKVRVYDNSAGHHNDDWTSVLVKKELINARIIIGTFEDDFESHEIRVDYHRKNGLDGKVSRIDIEMP